MPPWRLWRPQRALTVEPWADQVRIRVRMGLHTGTAEERGGDYFGVAVSRAARIADVGCGGQIIVSAATAALIAGDGRAGTSDLGAHRLQGLERPERLYRLDAEGLAVVDGPVLRGTALVGNLPPSVPVWSVVGGSWRTWTVSLVPGALVTVMGVGGVGKTRLGVGRGEGRGAAVRRRGVDDGVRSGGRAGGCRAVGGDGVAGATDVRSGHGERCGGRVGTPALLVAARQLRARDRRGDGGDRGDRGALPGVTVLATSREAFGLDGERIRDRHADGPGQRQRCLGGCTAVL